MIGRLLLFVCAALALVSLGFAQPPATVPADSPAVSVLVTPAPTLAYDSAATPKVSQSFKATLLKAAEKAYRDKDISRLDLARIRIAAVLRPNILAEAQAVVTEEAVKEKAMTPADATVGTFDWSKLLDFIVKVLPMILALFGL
jgi:hypothetical protein